MSFSDLDSSSVVPGKDCFSEYKKFKKERERRELSAAEIYHHFHNAVVAIDTVSTIDGVGKVTGNATGFIIKHNFILTAGHALLLYTTAGTRVPASPNVNFSRVERVFVTITGIGKRNIIYEADIIGIDGAADIGLLRIDMNKQYNRSNPCIPSSHPRFGFGRSRKYAIGRKCFVIGNPLGLDLQSITQGIVRDNRYFNRAISSCAAECVLTDADCLTGNSGSPLISENGHVIGMITLSLEDGQGNSMCGGVSSFFLKPVLNAMMTEYCESLLPEKSRKGRYSQHCEIVNDVLGKYYRYRKGYLGLTWNTINALDFVESKYRELEGVLVTGVDTSSGLYNIFNPLIVAGKRIILTRINKHRIGETCPQISPTVITWRLIPGDYIKVHYRLSTENYEKENIVSVRLLEYPYVLDHTNASNNLSLAQLNDRDFIDLKLDNKVIVTSSGSQSIISEPPKSEITMTKLIYETSVKCVTCLDYGYTCGRCIAKKHVFKL